MYYYPESLANLIEQFQKLPSIGRKSAERLAMYVLEEDLKNVKEFSESLINAKEKIHKCKNCGNICEDDLCNICKDPTRDKSIICVVEDARNLIAIEKSGVFNGYYHVLGGLISPSDDISGKDLNVNRLIERIDENEVKEVIFAISSTFEGQTTTFFLYNLLKDKNIKITEIASGVPVGSNLEYNDKLTLERALEDRRDLNDY